jgi:hypothetical protein
LNKIRIELKQDEKQAGKFYKIVFLLKVEHINRGWKPLPRCYTPYCRNAKKYVGAASCRDNQAFLRSLQAGRTS